MEPGASIYAVMLAAATAHLSRVNPKLTKAALDWNTKTLDSEGVKYAVENGTLRITDAEEKHRPIIYYTLMSVAEAFENQYGVNETWTPLKQTILKVMQGCRDQIRDMALEVPIARYNLQYAILDDLFGFNTTEFRMRKIDPNTVTVTSQKVSFKKADGQEEIPYPAIATVDREIYIGYSPESIRGESRAIDYQIKASGMSCIIIVAKKETMRDFMRVVSVMRGEYRRLNPIETRILISLYNSTDKREIAKSLNIAQSDAEKALNRIILIGYADQKGHLTAYGINTAIEAIKAAKQAP
ncbi:MAG: hypothetical protein V1875_00630 [Candidatus Altiarchaeota archaeon]